MGMNVNHSSSSGVISLTLTLSTGDHPIAEDLLGETGINVNIPAIDGALLIVEMLMKQTARADTGSGTGSTALVYAAQYKYDMIMKKLLELGNINLTFATENGRATFCMPEFWAVLSGGTVHQTQQ